MQIELDGQKIDVASDKLGDILDEVSQKVAASKRMIVAVTFNGEGITGDDLMSRRDEVVAPDSLILGSADPRQEAQAALLEIIDQLAVANEAQQAAADALQADKSKEASAELVKSLQIWQTVHLSVTSCLELFSGDLNVEGLIENLNELEESLRNVRDALKSGDLLGLADSLAYEWPETTENWQSLLKKIIETLASK